MKGNSNSSVEIVLSLAGVLEIRAFLIARMFGVIKTWPIILNDNFEQLEFSHIAGWRINWYNHFGKWFDGIYLSEHAHILFVPVFPPLGIYPTKTCSPWGMSKNVHKSAIF